MKKVVAAMLIGFVPVIANAGEGYSCGPLTNNDRRGDLVTVNLRTQIAEFSGVDDHTINPLRRKAGSPNIKPLFWGADQDHGGYVWLEFDTKTLIAVVYWSANPDPRKFKKNLVSRYKCSPR